MWFSLRDEQHVKIDEIYVLVTRSARYSNYVGTTATESISWAGQHLNRLTIAGVNLWGCDLSSKKIYSVDSIHVG